ncbi:MAG: hypothetical protein IIA08_02225 [Proteobacteria bacterium]|nr:hypothetical protein [Pseudomonadota bacterium]
MPSKLRLIALLLFLPFMISVASTSVAQIHVPEDLQGWQQWVLKDKEYRDCPFYFNTNASQPGDFICAWPGRMQLSVNASGAEFSQQWTVHAAQQWVVLPGDSAYWPDQVTVNNRPVEVIAHDNYPSVRLEPGLWRIAGRFEWDERPGVLRVPPASGLVSLSVDGKRVERPAMTRSGVFLGERQRETRAKDSVRAVVHRLVADEVPTRLTTHLQIDVSGSVREEVFGPILPDGFVPISIQSQLPVKFEADGKLRFQVRPGRWTIYLIARGPGVTDSITRPPTGTSLPDEEIWSYQSNDRLRVTAAEGLPPVDPIQVEVPHNWRTYPAFRMDAEATFAVTERSRGVVSASNELTLQRTMWLDFDGAGFFVEDSIGGTMRTDWRLDMKWPYAMLSATENDASLLITLGQEEGQTGIEVRQTAVGVKALGRVDTRAAMPVTGWNARFASVGATLNLPPGHKLLSASGVDRATGSWMRQWQLLDFFLVLIITIAVWRLFGRGAGIIALAALVLSFHELSAPAWLWLNLLIAIALMRVAPPGWLRKTVSSYQALSAIALLFVLVPFVAGQLRLAIYPQLEPQYAHYGLAGAVATPESLLMQNNEVDALKFSAAMKSMSIDAPQRGLVALDEMVTTAIRSRQAFARYAPNAIVQAGPGIPSWHWNSYSLSWSGPVDAEQTMRLVVMPRWLVSGLRVAAVALLLLFAGVLAAEVFKRNWTLPGGLKMGGQHTAGMLAAGMLVGLMGVSSPAEADIPDANILQQLEQRLLEPPDCVPRCAEIVSAEVDVGANAISMTLTVHALEDIAIPLPGSAEGWRPEAVLLDGGGGARIVRAPDNALWLRVTAGRHTVNLRGPVPAVDSLEIPFLTPPRVITVTSGAWFVAGIKDRRLTSGSLQLTRLQSDTEGDGTVRWESSRFPVFARVERVIELDLDWRVRTTVHRVAPTQGALTLNIPLLDGENIISGNFTVANERVLVAMNPQQQSVSWISSLPRQSPLLLQSQQAASWQEVWRFVVGNIWNAKFDGIPESNMSENADGARVAVFHPRGGEQLEMTATRPDASEGSTLAFDSVTLSVQHGQRSSVAGLQLGYRSTRGAQHVIQLPAAAEVTSVVIDGRAQTMRADAGQLTVPILPGSHTIHISWREIGEMGLRTTTPEIDIGAPASNINVQLTTPHDRWLLATSGPKLGPAVLYWSELAALIVFALILGRTGLSPLTTRHWLLLGLGFSTFSWPVLMLVAAWLLACGAREKLQVDLNWWRFNLIQIALAGITIIALYNVVMVLPQGLLGTPDMHVAGHNSHASVLSWFADRSESVLPVAMVVTVPMWIYKVLILVWALWLSFALLRWLPWVWRCFSSQGFWRPRTKVQAQA